MKYSHSRQVAGKKNFDSEATIRADLLFEDENGVDCLYLSKFIWTRSEIIGYEGNQVTPHLITPLTPSMLEVVTALAAEEEHSTSLILGCIVLQRDAQGLQLKSAAISQLLAQYKVLFPFKYAAVTPDLERKSDETEEVNIEEKEASNVKSGETEELDLETTQSTARQGTITPRTLNFEDEAGPSSPLRPIQVKESEEHLKAAEFCSYLYNL
ncbi:hypothetical protein Tco_1202762 [Tanacetum coccineum]